MLAALAVAYGVLATVVDNLYVATLDSTRWAAGLLVTDVFLYAWLAVFVWMGLRWPKQRAKLFLSGVIPIGLLAFTLLFAWPIHLPAVLLMAVAIYQARITFVA